MDIDAEAGRARTALVDRLRAIGVIQTDEVEAAFRLVPRHEFIEGAAIEAAYADVAIATKYDELGEPISSLSQPTIVATMLELGRLRPGHRVLEVGTGTGYNSALLRSLVGHHHPIVTIELEEELAVAAEQRFGRLGIEGIQIVTGDGASGFAERAPYDRIVVTTGAPHVASAWLDQLDDGGGRLVVPVVDAAGIGTVRCLTKRAADVRQVASVPCGFLPMRSRSGGPLAQPDGPG